MSRWGRRRRAERPQRGTPFPEPTPPGLNHVVLTGHLLEEPRRERSPRGDAVILLRLGFPVRDPECPRDLWTLARCEVEAPAGLLLDLEIGTPVLAWGQLSDREADSGGQGGTIVASAVKAGPAPGRRAR